MPDLTMNMLDNNTGIIHEIEELRPLEGRAYALYFDRFCVPASLVIEIADDGEICVVDAPTFWERCGDRGTTLHGGDLWRSSLCEFTISVAEAERVLTRLGLLDRTVEATA